MGSNHTLVKADVSGPHGEGCASKETLWRRLSRRRVIPKIAITERKQYRTICYFFALKVWVFRPPVVTIESRAQAIKRSRRTTRVKVCYRE